MMISSKNYRRSFRLLLFSIPFQSVALLTAFDFGLQPVHVALVIAIITAALYAASHSIRMARFPMFLIIGLVAILISLFLWGYTTPEIPYLEPPRPNRPGQLLYWLAAISYFVVAHFAAANLSSLDTAYKDWHWFVIGGLVSVGIGVYHYLAFYTGVPFPTELVFSNPSYGINAETQISGVLRFVGPFPEPSMFARYMIVALGIAYGLRERLALLIFALTLFLSLSTTGLIGIVVFGGLLLIDHRRDEFVQTTIRTIAIILPITLISPTVRNALWTLTVGKLDSMSVQKRAGKLFDGLLAWTERPLLGWGLGVERTNDGLSFLLINLGVVGIIPMAWLLFRSLWVRVVNRDSLAKGLQLALISVILLHIVSGPDWTLPYVWTLSGYLWGLSVSDAYD